MKKGIKSQMTKDVKSKFLSDKRLQSYNDLEEYRKNICISKNYYSLLSIFEVSLRNSIDSYFCLKFSNDWLDSNILHEDTKKRIKEAKSKIVQRREVLTHDKVIAELSFGFWTSLFRKSYSNIFRIKDIHAIFPNLPSKNKKMIHRNILDKKLNHIRKFRNRVFHYEKIINKEEYVNIDNDLYELLEYFDFEIKNFAREMMDE